GLRGGGGNPPPQPPPTEPVLCPRGSVAAVPPGANPGRGDRGLRRVRPGRGGAAAARVRLGCAGRLGGRAGQAAEGPRPGLAAGGEDAGRAGATLAYALEVTLRLLHPVMPFVTEELGRALTGVETLTLGPWPAERPGDLDPGAEAGMADLQEAIVALRRFRAEHRVPTASRP